MSDQQNRKYEWGIMFPETVIQLQRELTNHPELCKKLQEECSTVEDTLAAIATHCNLVVDGAYDMGELAGVLIDQLRKTRIIVVQQLPSNLR